MTDYTTTLRRSLIDRAGALGSYIQALQGRNGRSDDGFSVALEMCHAYTQLIQRQIDDTVEAARDPKSRQQKVRGWAKEFLEKEYWIDQRFARGSQGDVPRALKTMARHEFKRHGLHDQEPVLTVGAPDNFETHKSNLYDYLFGNLWTLKNYPAQIPTVPVNRKLSIISVPYIEGTRTLWYPITLGHEIGHMRLESEGSQALTSLIADWFSPTDAEFTALLIEAAERERRDRSGRPADEEERVEGEESDFDSLGTVRLIREKLASWVGEILCDLNSVRLFGPAGMSAIAEFLAVLSTTEEATTAWLSHPPLTLRLEVMLAFLRSTGQDQRSSQVSPWRDYVAANPLKLSLEENFVVGCFKDEINLERLISYALSWGEPYLVSEREPEVAWLTDELLDGIPGGMHCPGRENGELAVNASDAANAAWEARNALEEQTPRRRSDLVLLNAPEKKITLPEKRLLVDRLASKAIDSIEFARLWRSTAGTVESIRQLKLQLDAADVARLAQDCRDASARVGSAQPAAPAPESGPSTAIAVASAPDASEAFAIQVGVPAIVRGGILARTAITRRLTRTDRGRLVVTPLLTDSIQDAGVDLRLAPEFIVFRHSATGAFDALDKEQDPRMLQEFVDKDWGVQFILHPGELVLASTLEYVVLPDDLAAQVVTRSSYGRLGLITATAVQVQPGSRGCITLELVNHGDTPIALTPGARIGQLVFFNLEEPSESSPGKYRFPVGPEFSKVASDRDAEALELIKRAARTDLERAERFGSESRERQMEFRATLPEGDAAHFAEIGERERVNTTIARHPNRATPMHVNDLLNAHARGVPTAYLLVTGTAHVRPFAATLARYALSYEQSLEIAVSREAKVEIRDVEIQSGQPPRRMSILLPAEVEVRPTAGPAGLISVILPRFDDDCRRLPDQPEQAAVTVSTVGELGELLKLLNAAVAPRRPHPPRDDA